MPARITPLVTDQFYHLINCGTGAIPIFKDKHDYQKFLQVMLYYQNVNPPLRFAKFMQLNRDQRNSFLNDLKQKKEFLVEIITYCLMPNHFHLLIKQIKDSGIHQFMRKLQDSYSRHFNLKYKRRGGLFEGRFKAVHIGNEAQLLHLNRYIHLNPYSAYLIKNFSELETYPYSSFGEYLGNREDEICQKEAISNCFSKGNKYKDFVLDHADYQRTLQEIKHQILEENFP